MEKSNIEHLREILNGFNKTHGIDITEANEFLNAAEEEEREFVGAILEAKELKQKISDLEDELDGTEEPEYDNSDFVGLDTINWSLEKGNLIIQQEVEGFILRLKHKNCASVA